MCSIQLSVTMPRDKYTLLSGLFSLFTHKDTSFEKHKNSSQPSTVCTQENVDKVQKNINEE